MAGIPVYSISGVGGGFEIMDNYKIDKTTFSQEDLNTLLIGIYSIPDIIRNREYSNTITKLKHFIPKSRMKMTSLQSEQICIDFNSWIGNRNVESYLDIIKIAIRENKLLSFGYINHSGVKTERTVEPYQLVLKNSQWYFQSYCLKRNDFRLFKLTRLSNLKIQESNFVPQNYTPPFLDSSQIFPDTQITIKLRIHESIMERLLDYCDYDKFLRNDRNHYIVNFPFIENDYYYGILLSFGEQCECLEPLNVRSKIKQKIYNLSNIYDN